MRSVQATFLLYQGQDVKPLFCSLYSSSNYLTFFDGSGYSYITNHPGDMQAKQISFSFDIDTLDENALLILIPQAKEIANVSVREKNYFKYLTILKLQDAKCTTFMSVSLKKGHVQAEVHYNDSEPLVLTTKEKYNTGNRRHVEITKQYDKNTLRETLKLNDEQISKENVPSSAILRIKKINYIYFGGIPPEYLLNSSINTCLPEHTYNGLFGAMQAITGSSGITISLTKGSYYGLKYPEKEVSFKNAIIYILLGIATYFYIFLNLLHHHAFFKSRMKKKFLGQTLIFAGPILMQNHYVKSITYN